MTSSVILMITTFRDRAYRLCEQLGLSSQRALTLPVRGPADRSLSSATKSGDGSGTQKGPTRFHQIIQRFTRKELQNHRMRFSTQLCLTGTLGVVPVTVPHSSYAGDQQISGTRRCDPARWGNLCTPARLLSARRLRFMKAVPVSGRINFFPFFDEITCV